MLTDNVAKEWDLLDCKFALAQLAIEVCNVAKEASLLDLSHGSEASLLTTLGRICPGKEPRPGSSMPER